MKSRIKERQRRLVENARRDLSVEWLADIDTAAMWHW